MKNASLFHGQGCNPTQFWLPYIKDYLEKNGYSVWLPQLPNTDNADLKDWLPYSLSHGHYNFETVLIGHSAGCALILSILERIDVKIKLAVLVSGYTTNFPKEEYEPILQSSYDWTKIRNNCEKFIIINSDNDPWGYDDKHGKILQEHLGGELIILHDKGHLGSSEFNQPYPEFPELVKILDKAL
jgi:predicted alpha/beta hydrolase family esterase